MQHREKVIKYMKRYFLKDDVLKGACIHLIVAPEENKGVMIKIYLNVIFFEN